MYNVLQGVTNGDALGVKYSCFVVKETGQVGDPVEANVNQDSNFIFEVGKAVITFLSFGANLLTFADSLRTE